MTTADAAFRLPRTVEPQRYDLTLTPDLATATFAGEERVRVHVKEPVQEIVLHAVDLDIHEASLTSEQGDELAVTFRLDDDRQELLLSLSGVAQPGPWSLHLTFSGTLNDKLKGFYRSTFKDDDGVEHVIATTQFEATDARRAFPCWDEPDLKAVFAVTLVVDEGLTALSNAAEVEDKQLGNGKRQVTFADTMVMSTYLVAFVVGPLELTPVVDVGGVPLRVACVPGKKHLADFALEIGAHSLNFFTEWFGIGYPGDKLDLVALPDFASGAMENLGCVTFREAVLLVDPDTASRTELQRVADVVAHEIAHMWFGDLVTMRWWNGIWLNEAFATFMEMLCVDDFRPEWERWVVFGRSRSAAMIIDGLAATRTIEYPVGRPEEADGMFDVLTYEKGAAVLRMLQQYLGEGPFREGIRRYIAAHAYGNTETGDLWDAIEEATGEPARSTMDSWIFQEGYPVVGVEADGARLMLTQQRFMYSGEDAPTEWQVPVMVRAGTAGGDVRERTLLTSRSGTLDLDAPATWVVANDGGAGFYRVRYSSELLAALRAKAGEVLAPLERLNLVTDTWAAAVAGLAPLEDFLGLAQLPPDEADPNVWWAVADSLGFLARTVEASRRDQYTAWARSFLRPAFDRVGWDWGTEAGDQAGPRQSHLLLALGTWAADPEIQAQCAERFAGLMAGAGTLAADLVEPVVKVAALTGGAAAYDQLVERWRKPATPQEETRSLYALADAVEDPLIERTMELGLNEVRPQNAPFLFMRLMGNEVAQERAWRFLAANWDRVTERFPDNLVPRMAHDYLNPSMVNGIVSFPAELAEEAIAFLEAHPLAGHEKQVAQGIERARVHAAFRRRGADALASFIGS